MVEINGPMLLILIALAGGYWLVDQVREPINKTAHVVQVAGKKTCHALTFGKKCGDKEKDHGTQP